MLLIIMEYNLIRKYGIIYELTSTNILITFYNINVYKIKDVLLKYWSQRGLC